MDQDPDPAIFVIELQDANKKIIIIINFFCLFPCYLLHHFKDKKSKRSHKSGGIKVFLTIFAW
jgi:hypothetical protein